jgi:hypothetical protein
MARFDCKCGTTLSNSVSPNNIELRVYTDKEWNEYMQGDFIDPIAIPSPKFDVWKCPGCQRVHVFNGNILIKTYQIEDDEVYHRSMLLSN